MSSVLLIWFYCLSFFIVGNNFPRFFHQKAMKYKDEIQLNCSLAVANDHNNHQAAFNRDRQVVGANWAYLQNPNVVIQNLIPTNAQFVADED